MDALRVLLVEDDLGDAHITRELLEREGSGTIALDHVTNLRDAIDSISASRPYAVLLDLSLPDSAPTATLQSVLNCGTDFPVIVLTGDDDTRSAEQAVRGGAQDYLLKGDFSGKALERTIRYSVERHRVRSEIEHLALHDPLTDLPNRATFHDRLEQLVTVGKRSAARFAVHFVDLDHFKNVNDSLGHAVGDAVLISAAQRLRSLLRNSDTVARLGGDEFAVLQTNVESKAQVAILAAKIVAAFQPPFIEDGHDIQIGATVGSSTFIDDADKADELLRKADSALYAAKNSGRGCYRLFDDGVEAAINENHRIEHRLQQAVAQNQFHLHYQAIQDLRSGNVVAFEALMRWSDPLHREQQPANFLPLLENLGLLKTLNPSCFQQACDGLALAQRSGFPDARMHINLSLSQIEVGITAAQMAAALERSGIAAGCIVLELTETGSLNRAEPGLWQAFSEFSELGVLLAMDDFGTGTASLRSVQKLPLDILKLDRCFVSPLPEDDVSCAIVGAVVQLGQQLDRMVICKGVENADQAGCLAAIGARFVQGFHYHRPQPMEIIAASAKAA